MKEKLLMAVIGFVIILFLAWGVVAVASSYNQALPRTAEVNLDYGTVNLDDGTQSEINLNTDRRERPEFPKARKLETGRR